MKFLTAFNIDLSELIVHYLFKLAFLLIERVRYLKFFMSRACFGYKLPLEEDFSKESMDKELDS
jgi:hypothetical protein